MSEQQTDAADFEASQQTLLVSQEIRLPPYSKFETGYHIIWGTKKPTAI